MEDSRLKGYFTTITHPTLPLERTFCANCGKPKGWVTKESYETITALQILVICDDCDQKLGKLDLPQVAVTELAV